MRREISTWYSTRYPALLFDQERLSGMDRNTLLIDLASVRAAWISPLQRKCRSRPSGPYPCQGGWRPKSSGLFIKDTLLNMIKEGI